MPGRTAVGRRRLGRGTVRPAAERPSAESQHDESSVHPTYLALVGVILLGACGRRAPWRRPRRCPSPARSAPRPTSRRAAGRSRRPRPDRPAGDAVDSGHLRRLRRRRLRAREAWVDSLHVGGIIVSVGSPLDVAAKLNRLQQRSPLPLLVASDLEGGTSLRFNGGTPFPPNMGVGATGSDSAAYDIGRITALEGRAVGIHLAFAPVADVNNNPANPIINTRAFGEDPADGGPAGGRRGARPPGPRDARHRQALPRPRRHRHRFAPGAARHRLDLGAGSTRSSWCPSAPRSPRGWTS